MKTIISTDAAPAAIGPYSQAVRAGDLLFVAGQIPLGADGSMVGEGAAEQTRQVMENISAILAAADCNCQAIVKTTIYLVDLDDFTTVNEVYGSFFNDTPPARATVAVAALPKGARVEIDAIACLSCAK